MRLSHLLAVAAIVGATPVQAEIGHARSFHATDSTAPAFAATRLNDAELAGVVGMGGGPGFRILRDSTNVNARLVEQQSGQLLVATFDNWFTDIGAALIFSNIIASR